MPKEPAEAAGRDRRCRASSSGSGACSGGVPRRSAALPAPLIRQPHSRSTASMCGPLDRIERVARGACAVGRAPAVRTSRRAAACRRSSESCARSMTFSSSRTLPGHVMLLQRLHDALRHLGDAAAEIALMALDEEPDERRDVLAAFAQRRQADRKHAQAIVEVGAESPARDGGSRSRCVAAITRTSTRAASRDDRRARTRLPAARAAAWPGARAADRRSRRGRSCRRRRARSAPAACATAPVNAPFSWPNSSLSISVGGSAAQLTRTSAAPRRRLRACSARANSSLPVPVSPSSSTDEFVGATSPRRASAARSDGPSPTMSSKSSRS